MFMIPNDGSGDNVGFSFTGPGVNITGIGGMACFDWCSGPISDPNIAQPSQIFLTGFETATIGGKSYDPTTLAFNSLFDASGTLNASTAGSVGGGDSFIQFMMTAPTNGSWALTLLLQWTKWQYRFHFYDGNSALHALPTLTGPVGRC
jgi:hypothetical protein